MDRVNSPGMTAAFMKENTSTIRNTVMESSSGLMAKSTMVPGPTADSTALDFTLQLTVAHGKGSGSTERGSSGLLTPQLRHLDIQLLKKTEASQLQRNVD